MPQYKRASHYWLLFFLKPCFITCFVCTPTTRIPFRMTDHRRNSSLWTSIHIHKNSWQTSTLSCGRTRKSSACGATAWARFSAATWQQIGRLEILASAGYHAFAIDLPSFGQSESATIPRDTWLAELLNQLNIKPPVLLAVSISGGFALPFITFHPERIVGFVAVAPISIRTFRERLHSITVPVLANWGENDRTIPISDAKILVKSVKHGQLVIIPNGSHAPYMSNPNLFNHDLIRFLSTINISASQWEAQNGGKIVRTFLISIYLQYLAHSDIVATHLLAGIH